MDALDIEIPRSFTNRFAAVYQPTYPDPNARDKPYYGIMLPSTPILHRLGCRYNARIDAFKASSKARPVVVPVSHSSTRPDCLATPQLWQRLLDLCDTSNLPRDFALRGRRLRARVQPYQYENKFVSGVALALEAICVLEFDERPITEYLDQFTKKP